MARKFIVKTKLKLNFPSTKTGFGGEKKHGNKDNDNAAVVSSNAPSSTGNKIITTSATSSRNESNSLGDESRNEVNSFGNDDMTPAKIMRIAKTRTNPFEDDDGDRNKDLLAGFPKKKPLQKSLSGRGTNPLEESFVAGSKTNEFLLEKRHNGILQGSRNERSPPLPNQSLSCAPIEIEATGGSYTNPFDDSFLGAPTINKGGNLAAEVNDARSSETVDSVPPIVPALVSLPVPPNSRFISQGTSSLGNANVGLEEFLMGTSNLTDDYAGLEEFLTRTSNLTDDYDWLEEFLVRTRNQTDEWLDKVYGSETIKNQSSDGKLTTSLCEDVFYFAIIQIRTFRDLLSESDPGALVLAVCVILFHMRSKQVHARDGFLQDLETCCAASSDFHRMGEKCEDVISQLESQCDFSEDAIITLRAGADELVGVYGSDAVHAARSVHVYVFNPINEEIGTRLFEEEWEVTLVDNELAVSLVRTLEDFHEDLERYMDEFMLVKSMMSLMSATVIFYVKCLLRRAEKHRNDGNAERPFFGNVKKGLDRMTGDIKVMRDYFEGLIPEIPLLKMNIDKDFEILATIHELMSIAAGLSVSDAKDFILVLQKRIRDVDVTKHIVTDLWHIVAPREESYVGKLVDSMGEQLVAIGSIGDILASEVNDRSYVKGLRPDEMAAKLYAKSRRNQSTKPMMVNSASVDLVCHQLCEEYRTKLKPHISASTRHLSTEYKTRVEPQILASTSHLSEQYWTNLRRMRSEWEESMEKLQKIVCD